MIIDFVFTILPALIFGGIMVYFSDEIADFFSSTGSTSLIRGLENPWTFKVFGWAMIIGYPLYQLLMLWMSASLALTI